ncbi:prohibitin family protein [Priestia endophytica]|jgi:regulator of protease activity HflC (stomatin/prohibitin superfamily)|uniref:Regulator of protease activity HflC, stomatin/prohibitin superfamily n=1 Tax=Priestia endophytica DSM 13796 TaxID=1121089 RepID=A0A1I6BJ78_9BACI|nr:prohibitin family protein [Priestia endophytica]KAB2492625.1 prohibitin family protein [Priestia endophytica]KYG25671.1 hypothetical protein AZF06_17785 [Priestia endophytica]MBG9811286.1 hypothetical protein [Priestia endophytica]SFQ80983.1 Regulator of protease activity HflC, stomatin/prohibitin superfamily [Priestia endophytica DSM 13796]
MLKTGKAKLGAVLVGLAIILGGVLAIMSITQVDQGHIGVVYNRSGGVEKQTLGQGWHFVSPWKKVTQYPVAMETVSYEDVPLATKDGKPLDIDATYNYANNPEKVVDIFNKFKGAKPEVIENTFLQSRMKDAALSVTSKYTILEIFQKREQIKTEIEQEFIEDANKYGFVVSDFVLGTPKPDEKTQKAIQNVVDAQQKLEAMNVEKQQAEVQAEKAKVEAQGKADAEIIKAKAEAEANKVVSESLTPEVIEMKRIEKWDGDKNVQTKVVGSDSDVIVGGK